MAEEEIRIVAVIREIRNVLDIIINLLVTFDKLKVNIAYREA
jgi:hypothetical protein